MTNHRVNSASLSSWHVNLFFFLFPSPLSALSLSAIINHMAMFEKGLEHFDDATQAIMVKHLNTTLGTDAANVLTKLHALDAFLELNYQALLTNEQRKEVGDDMEKKVNLVTENVNHCRFVFRFQVLAQLPSQQKQKMADLYQLLTSSKVSRGPPNIFVLRRQSLAIFSFHSISLRRTSLSVCKLLPRMHRCLSVGPTSVLSGMW